jgi:Flp pilus assembly pilin Flp
MLLTLLVVFFAVALFAMVKLSQKNKVLANLADKVRDLEGQVAELAAPKTFGLAQFEKVGEEVLLDEDAVLAAFVAVTAAGMRNTVPAEIAAERKKMANTITAANATIEVLKDQIGVERNKIDEAEDRDGELEEYADFLPESPESPAAPAPAATEPPPVERPSRPCGGW